VEPASADPHADETALCARCHESAVAEFRLPNRHPVLEGDMSCTDCHDVHGDRPGVLANRRLQQRCEECHAGTVGPFVHEHEAGRIDGCAACHQPHGSPNRLLLTMTPVRDLCLSCHPSTPATHTLAGFSPFLECAQCHTEVHGSDLSPRLFR
jgi:DmsE family decaheme c-type cytochrome